LIPAGKQYRKINGLQTQEDLDEEALYFDPDDE